MARVASTKIALLWYQICATTGGRHAAWNVSAAANPDTLEGGIPFNIGACLTEPLYLCATGTGDAQITCSFGGPFVGPVPTTFNPGWTDDQGNAAHWDLATAQGSASVGPGNNQVAFPTTPGAIFSNAAKTFGRWYFEYTVTYDIFSQQAGVGIMRKGALLPYLTNGQYSVTDNIGGAMVQGGSNSGSPTYQSQVNAFGSPYAPDPLLWAPSGTTFGVAIALIPQALYVPQLFSSIPLPRLVCCPEEQNKRLRIQAKALQRALTRNG